MEPEKKKRGGPKVYAKTLRQPDTKATDGRGNNKRGAEGVTCQEGEGKGRRKDDTGSVIVKGRHVFKRR